MFNRGGMNNFPPPSPFNNQNKTTRFSAAPTRFSAPSTQTSNIHETYNSTHSYRPPPPPNQSHGSLRPPPSLPSELIKNSKPPQMDTLQNSLLNLASFKPPSGQLPFYQARGESNDFHKARLSAFGNKQLIIPPIEGGQDKKPMFAKKNSGPGNVTGGAPFNTQNNFQRGPKLDIKFEDVFEVESTIDGVKWYFCRACKLPSIPEINVKSHETGKRHQAQVKTLEGLAQGNTKNEKLQQFRALLNRQVFEVKSQYNEIMSGIKDPLLGMSYCIEIVDSNFKEPAYFCVLCLKGKMDPRAVVRHFLSQKHRMAYFENHFPALLAVLKEKERFENESGYRQGVLDKICVEIENRAGRGDPLIYESTEFDAKKEILFEEVKKKRHCSEETIENSEKVLLEKIDFDKIEAVPINFLNAKKVKEVNISAMIGQFKRKASIVIKELDEKLMEYQKDPGSHPQYSQEWEAFWERKNVQNPNVKMSDVLDEWYTFFEARMLVLHREEVKLKTEEIGKEMKLSPQDIKNVDITNATGQMKPQQKRPNERNEGNDFKKQRFDGGAGPSNAQFNKQNNRQAFNNDSKGSRFGDPGTSGGSQFQFNRQNNQSQSSNDFYKKPQFGGAGSSGASQFNRQFNSNQQGQTSNFGQRQNFRSNANSSGKLITTLRILTTLEEELGLMGQKILDLLSKALILEQQRPSSSDELLSQPENFNTLAMTKEKLLGLQAVSLVPVHKIPAVERALDELAKLLEPQNSFGRGGYGGRGGF